MRPAAEVSGSAAWNGDTAHPALHLSVACYACAEVPGVTRPKQWGMEYAVRAPGVAPPHPGAALGAATCVHVAARAGAVDDAARRAWAGYLAATGQTP